MMNTLRSVMARNWTANTIAANMADVNQALRTYTGNQNAVLSLTDDQVREVFERIVPRYEGEVDIRVADLPTSYERLALLSFSWNNPALIGQNLRTYLQNGDRAAAWVEIRYRSNGGASRSAGIAKRRYMESEVFGLYDQGTTAENITKDAALDVYEAVTRHRTAILAYENEFSARINNANNDYATFLATVADGDRSSVDTLETSLTLAGDALKSEYLDAAANPENNVVTAASISSLDIQVADDDGGTLTGSSRTEYAASSDDQHNDLLIGRGGVDRLQGLGGSDALFGEGGNDILEGGAGSDYLVGGSGDDVLDGGDDADVLLGGSGRDTYKVTNGDIVKDDSTGSGEVLWGNVKLTGGTRTDEDPANTYYSEDRQYTYVLDGTVLTVRSAAGESITIKDYVNRRLEIVLNEEDDDDDDQEESPDMGPAETRASPLTIDLNGDGVGTQAYSRDRYFDYDGNGIAESTAWVDGNDGLLVRDLNGNGIIDDGRELFGNSTRLSDGSLATNGFIALAELDENGDGLIDEQDSAFAELRVWRDLDGDGRTESGELLTLAEAGIAAFRTQWSLSTFVDTNGQAHKQVGTAIRDDGSDAAVADVWYTSDASRRLNQVEVPFENWIEVRHLPDAKAFGNLMDLRQAMALDMVLRGLVEAYVDEQDPSLRDGLLKGIIYQWADANDVIPNSRGLYVDARELAVVEMMAGRPYTNDYTPNDPNPRFEAGNLLTSEFNKFLQYVGAQIEAQTRYADTGIFRGGFASGYSHAIVNLDAFKQYLIAAQDLQDVQKIADLVVLSAALASYSPTLRSQLDAAYVDLIAARPGIAPFLDVISALTGTDGADVLYGGGGKDAISGQKGDDTLYGQAGNDIYIYRPGDGNDSIFDSAGSDQLYFMGGILPEHLSLTRDVSAIIVRIDVGGVIGEIRINNVFEGTEGALREGLIEQFRFENGTTWNQSQILAAIVQVATAGSDGLYGSSADETFAGLDGDDEIAGYGGNDILHGDGGNDSLSGGSGNDTLVGGTGNDTLSGGAGSDLYIFNLGDGQDTIDNYDVSAGRHDELHLGQGIAPSDVTARRQGSSLILSFANGTDQITVNNYFSADGTGGYQLDQIRFADETLWNVETVKALVLAPTSGNDTLQGYASDDVLAGGDGNDTLIGNGGNDLLQGDSGNDVLDGGAGSDIYLFNVGDGQDTINNYDVSAGRFDVLQLGEGITPGDVTARRQGNSLILSFANGTDQITVTNYFSADGTGGYQLDQIRFADETVWDVETVKTLVLAPTSGKDTLQGYASDDVLAGGDGDDTLIGNGGNDLLQGDSGNDVLDGGVGNDVLQGGVGNDTLSGGAGSDTYLFNSGDGQDIIDNYDTSAGRFDVLQLGPDIASGDVTARRQGSALVLNFANDTDQITVINYFSVDGTGGYQLDQIRFADETVWDVATVKALVLVPTSGNDILQGYASDDVLTGGDGNDTIYGNAGDDVLQGESGSDVLYGGAGHDTLMGGEGNDSLNGDAGDDVLQGGAGNDTLNGGAGSDTYLFNAGDGQDVISNYDTSAGRVDVLQLGEGILSADVIARRSNNDLVLTFAGSDDRVTVSNYFIGDAAGNYQIDQIRFADETTWDVETVKALVLLPTTGADTLQGYASDDTISGGAGDDIMYGNDGNDTLHGQDGNDALYGGTGDDTITGGAGADTLNGDAGDDVLNGGADNDILRGGAGNDHLTGGLGNDQLEGGEGDDHYHFAAGDGQDTINDAQGLSTVHLSGLPLEDVYLRRDGTTLVLGFAGSATDQIRLVNFFDASTQLALRGVVIDTGDGTPWSLDAAAVDAAALLGTSLDDVIDGNTLDNAIEGLAGNDTLRGGAGADSLDGGAGNDALYGQAGDDVLTGGEGNDLLDGGAGADQMAGGAGDDTYVVDDAGDVVTEVADAGLDIVQSSVTYLLPDNVEQLVLTGDADIDGAGNALDNTLTGNGGNNHLQGLAGDDVLFGNDGDDTLDGGIGDDQLYGGDGADVLIGGAGQDLLDGGAGVDQLAGGAGDDTYRVDESGDVIVELAGEGIDVVQSTAYSYALSANVEHLALVQDSGAYEGTGNALDNVLTGNSNDNRLDGGAGVDTLVGGLGNDTYVVDNAGDVVVENAGEGTDTVESSISYTLGATLENLTLLGTANLDATGNTGDNVIRGNAGNNRIEGGAGADTLYGGAGDDYYVAVSASDRVYEYAGEGIDTVERVFETNLVLENNVENLILGAGITTGNGNGLDNTITGNAGDNTLAGLDGDDVLHGLDGDDALFGGNGTDALYGGTGDDYLDGGAGIDYLEGGVGNDNYIVDHSDDVVVEAAGAGTDQVQASASYALSANVENLFLTGSAAINGAGNDLDNYIAGNGAANMIHGGGGNDTIVGGGGDDTLIGGTGDDKYVFDASSGSDVVDNADGGFDGIFFTNGITRERLSFSRDGDDLLIFVDAGSTPAVRVLNHFLGGDAAIDYVQPDGGYYLTTAEINQIVAGGSTGGEYDQVIEGTAAGEQLVGSSGKDLIKGLAGDDQLFGMSGDDTLQGGEGDDYLSGGNGSGAGSGDDRLEGGAGADTLVGEDGVNTLIGGAGNDNYVYGGGQDTIDNTGGGTDGVFFNNGIAAGDLAFYRDGDDLVITVAGNASGFVRVTGHFLGGDLALDFVQPASGNMLNTAAINALVQTGYPGSGEPGGGDPDPGEGDPGTGGGNEGNDADYPNVVTGTANGEQLLGSSGRDLIRGLGGADELFGFGGDDKLDGGDGDDYISGGNGSFSGSGNDILIGGAGNDTLVGEDGNDMLIGGAGDDFYYYASGSGSDTVDNTGGGTDWLYFADVNSARLSFHQDGDDLIVRVDGDAGQQIRVLDHFLGGEHAISYVQPSNGNAIPAANIPALLTALPQGSSATTFLAMETSSISSDGLTSLAAASTDSVALGEGLPQAAFQVVSKMAVPEAIMLGERNPASDVGEPTRGAHIDDDVELPAFSVGGAISRPDHVDSWRTNRLMDRHGGIARYWELDGPQFAIDDQLPISHSAAALELDGLIHAMAGFQSQEAMIMAQHPYEFRQNPEFAVQA